MRVRVSKSKTKTSPLSTKLDIYRPYIPIAKLAPSFARVIFLIFLEAAAAVDVGRRAIYARLSHRVTGSTGSECPAPVPVPGTGRYRPVMSFVLVPHTD
jgi:hypothetical protein